MRGAKLNVDINLAWLTDEELKATAADEVDRLMTEAMMHRDKAMVKVHDAMKGG